MKFLSLNITPATRLAAAATGSTSAPKKRVAGSKRTYVSDSESESEVIFTAGSSKPTPKRARASVIASSSKAKFPRAQNGVRRGSSSTSDTDSKPVNSYANSLDGFADTPATTISSRSSSFTRDKGKGKAVAVPDSRVSTPLPTEVIDSQDEDEDEDGGSVGEPENESGLSELDYEDDEEEEEEDEDEYEEEDDISISIPKGKGKAKAKPSTPTHTPRGAIKGKGKATAASSAASTTGSSTDGEEDEEAAPLEDLPQDIPVSSVSGGSSRVALAPSIITLPLRVAPVRRRYRAVRVWAGRRTRV